MADISKSRPHDGAGDKSVSMKSAAFLPSAADTLSPFSPKMLTVPSDALDWLTQMDMDGDGVCEIVNSSPNFPAIYYERGGQLYGVDLKSVITAAWPEMNYWDYPSAAHWESNVKSVQARHISWSSALDLHVLGTPPAFILSQDQTLI